MFFCAQYRFLVDGYVVMEARKLVRRLKVLGREEHDDDDDDDDDDGSDDGDSDNNVFKYSETPQGCRGEGKAS